MFLSALDGETINGITGNFRFNGIHLPEFGASLTGQTPAEEWPEELLLIRTLLQQGEGSSFSAKIAGFSPQQLNDRLTKARKLSDFRHSIQEPAFLAGSSEECTRDWQRLLDGAKPENLNSYWIHRFAPPLLQLSEHFCQIRFHRLTAKRDAPEEVTDEQTWAWLFFDSRWMAANRDLATSLLRYGSGTSILIGE